MPFLEIDPEVKRKALENSLVATQNEIFGLCLSCGIDPDTLDTSDPSGSSEIIASSKEGDLQAMLINRIVSLCGTLEMITEKLASLPPAE